jgi:hypothetical protein
MTQTEALKRIKRAHWRTLERLVQRAYHDGMRAGIARARGAARRGRTIRADARVEGLVDRIERHFGLARYDFEVRVVHGASGRRVPARDPLSRYLTETPRREA